MVPNGWEKSDLTHLITIKHGFAFKSEFYSDKGQYVLLTPGSFYETGGFRDQGSKTKYYIGDIPDGYILSQGDMLLAMTEQAEGLLGSALFVPENNRYLHNQRLGLVQILNQEKVCKDFLYLFFNSPSIRKQITEQSTGTKVKHTSPDRLCSVIGLIPPLKEQQKIAEIISSWDQAISATERLLENSQQQKKALMQQLLTGKKRLLDENGERFHNKWNQVLVSEICHIGRGRVISKTEIEENKGTFPVYSSQTLHNGVMGYLNSYDFDGEVVTWTTDGVNAGTVFYRTGKFNCTNVCGTLTPKKSSIDLKFLAFSLSRETYKYVSHTLANPKLMNGVMGTISLKIPSFKEQQKIAKIISVADKEIETLQKKLDCLKQEKKALMQQLLTGKKRVKVAA
ncbi:restriction endonuclease subunit S [Acinetobacter pittii]|uniref:restriction endonuclease subunit S n=1 Tax=Acinetobacter TaxID=469 RepID=UPI001022F7A4|nr:MULTISPECIES: restriction endonuclease subunit S [Acinetobacter]MDA3493569.1 restriction endonuclease subunit S [Acinetobacter sp. AOR33_HL]RZH19016.1 restriction endonuclease subunit S [Acinetobacter pittii]